MDNDKTQRPPNILFLFTDDQRFDTIRALGNEEIYTPNLDYLVREGTSFTNAYIMGGSCGAVCMPSRAMMMSGRTLFRIEKQGREIPPEHKILPEYLREKGYETFGTGKWHNGTPSYTRGFSDGGEIYFGGMDDHWNVAACDFHPAGDYPAPRQHMAKLHQDEPPKEKFRIYDHITNGKHSTELFCDAAIDFLGKRSSEKPFFAYISFLAPHDPRTMPQKYLNMYDPDRLSLPKNFMPGHPFDNGHLSGRDEGLAPWPRRPKEILRHIAEYYAMISHLDAEMGRVLDALKATGEASNTVIIFSSDNGLALGQHGLMGKQNIYDHSIHVPLILKGPGIPKNQKRNALCYLIDIYPTVCGLAGIPKPESVEGNNLESILKNPKGKGRDHLLFAYRNFQRGIRDDRFKLIEYLVEGVRTRQLFDLATDPQETDNLADSAAYSPEVERLTSLLPRWKTELADPFEDFWQGYS